MITSQQRVSIVAGPRAPARSTLSTPADGDAYRDGFAGLLRGYQKMTKRVQQQLEGAAGGAVLRCCDAGNAGTRLRNESDDH